MFYLLYFCIFAIPALFNVYGYYIPCMCLLLMLYSVLELLGGFSLYIIHLLLLLLLFENMYSVKALELSMRSLPGLS